LGWIAVKFGPVELFGVAVLGMTIIGSLSQGSVIKGLLSGLLGVLLSTVGMDLITGTPRFTFGQIYLYSGIEYTAALIGLFSIPQAVKLVEVDSAQSSRSTNKITDSILRPWSEIKELFPTFLKSSFIGVFTGIIPGTGGETGCWFAYNEAKRLHNDDNSFGKGSPYGVAAPEAANNAVVGGALVPTITLGIPGSSSTAVLLGGLMIHGIMPGPSLMTQYAGVTYTLLWAVLLSTIVMFIEGLAFTKVCIFVTHIENKILSVAIVVLCVIGSFAINNSIFDVGVMFAFGILGYFMDKLSIPVAPLVVGLILGGMLDVSLHQSLLIGQGSWMVFVKNPICAVFLLLALISLVQSTPMYDRWRAARRAQKTAV
jgi:putative tricarboxylic transport membrane protein